MIGNSDDETNFPHKLLLTNRQIQNLRKTFANNLSANIKLSKIQLSKIGQLGGYLGRILAPSLKTGLPVMKNVLKPLAKRVLIPLGLTAAASAADTGIHKKILSSGTTSLIILIEEMEEIMKKIKSLKDSVFLLKGVSETIQNEAKEQKGGLLGMLLGIFGASLLGNTWTGKGINRARYGSKDLQSKGDGMIRAGYGSERSSIKNF